MSTNLFDPSAGAEPTKNRPERVFMLLHGRYQVDLDFYNSVRWQLGNVCGLLDPCKSYKARQLCGAEYWSQLSRSEGKVAGSCIAQMVKNGDLQLVKVTASGSYPNRYELRPATTA